MEKSTEKNDVVEQKFDAAQQECTALLDHMIARNVPADTAYRALLMAAGCTAVARHQTLEHAMEGLAIFYTMALAQAVEDMLAAGAQSPA